MLPTSPSVLPSYLHQIVWGELVLLVPAQLSKPDCYDEGEE